MRAIARLADVEKTPGGDRIGTEGTPGSGNVATTGAGVALRAHARGECHVPGQQQAFHAANLRSCVAKCEMAARRIDRALDGQGDQCSRMTNCLANS